MRALIVDDERPARARLRRLLTAEPDVEVVAEAAGGAEGVLAIREHALDLVFLDIQMPVLDGFSVIDEIGPEAMPLVLFVTAYDDHALKAFEVRALDYLMKPVAPDRLHDAVGRARERLAAPSSSAQATRELHELVESLSLRKYLRRILVHHDERATLLPVERIDRIEADRNYVWLHVAGKALLHRDSITALAERLDPEKFLRLNRSTVVRFDAIRELHPWSHGDYRVVMHDGATLMWSRRYRARQRADFGEG